jgi:uncharacterized membrane protein YhhN
MMKILPHTDATDRIILIASAVFGLVYLVGSFGFDTPYPLNVLIKSAGIHLLAAYALRRNAAILALGLFLGAWGDIFLALQPVQLAAGIGAFGLGHVIYIALFADRLRKHGRSGIMGWVMAGILIAAGGAMLLYLQPHFGDLRIAASIYNGIILTMAVLAVLGRAPRPAIIGALLFVVSDGVLAMRLFADMLPWAGPVVWTTYYLGQAGIALGLSQKGS